jgi:hypothetical protein
MVRPARRRGRTCLCDENLIVLAALEAEGLPSRIVCARFAAATGRQLGLRQLRRGRQLLRERSGSGAPRPAPWRAWWQWWRAWWQGRPSSPQ